MIKRYKNKYNWEYTFTYESDVWGTVQLVYVTNECIQEANYIADNNMRWDASKNLVLHSRKRVGKPYQKNIAHVERSEVC